MSEPIRSDSTVEYTVKELLDEQTCLLRQIDGKVDMKADKADLVPLVLRLDDHHTRLVRIEDDRKAEATAAQVKSRFRNKIWAVSTAIVVPLAVALILVFVH